MTTTVFLAVLAAALMHAGWNAALKVKLEPLLGMTLISGCTTIIALPLLIWFGLPRVESWPYLAASWVAHTGYYLTLSEAYRRADMSQAYPIARGGAPLLTALGSILILHEPVAPLAILGIALLGGGVMLMSLGRTAPDLPGIGFALLTSVVICGYTLSDGQGARVSGDPHAYSAALFVITGIPLPVLVAIRRGPRAFVALRRFAWLGFGGGAMSLAAYWIAIWAMTVAPIALVAALRETSILFGSLIAVLVLREPWRPRRAAAALLIVSGIAAMRLA